MAQVENEKKSLVVDCEQGGKDSEPVPLFSLRSHRLRIGLLLMFGLWASVSMRLNLSMAVTCMVNTTAVYPHRVEYNESYTVSSTCSRQLDNVTDAQTGYDGDLLWTPSMQSLLLSATFYGGLVTIAISGYIADRFAPKIILICTTLNYVLMSLLAPWLARTSYYLYFVSRVVMGLGEGFVMPSLASLAARWFPATERSTVAAMYTSGNQLAAGLCPVISAALCAGSFLGGWPAIFIAFAAVGLLWLVLWSTLASNYPADNRWTSQAEKDYLHGITHNNNKKRSPVPWSSMLCSAPVLANLACQFSFQMCAAIMQGFLPTYFKQVLALPLASNGLYTMIPFMCQLPAKNILAGLSDYMKRRGILAPTTAVKLFQSIGSFGSSAALLGLALLPSCDRPWIAAGLLAVYGGASLSP